MLSNFKTNVQLVLYVKMNYRTINLLIAEFQEPSNVLQFHACLNLTKYLLSDRKSIFHSQYPTYKYLFSKS
jgi:hypothetical protein